MSAPLHTAIRELAPTDHASWLAMRQQLWPGSTAAEAAAWQARPDAVTLLAEAPAAAPTLVGFAEVGLRLYADGCDTSPVAFLEGWYVHPSVRGRTVGAQLVRAAAAWAIRQGLSELASDSLLDDSAANLAHLHVGFSEVERSIKYRMSLRAF